MLSLSFLNIPLGKQTMRQKNKKLLARLSPNCLSNQLCLLSKWKAGRVSEYKCLVTEKCGGKAGENAQDEALIWGVPGSLRIVLKRLALAASFWSPSLSDPLLFFPPLLPLKQPIRAWNIRPRLNVKVEIFPLFMLLWHVTVISSRHKVPGMAKHNTQKRSEAQSKGLDRRAEKTIQRFKHTVFLSHAPAWLLNPVERKNNNRGELWKWKVKMIHSCLWDLACLINENDKLDQELRWQKALWWYMFYIHVAGFAADFVLQHKDNIILQHWRWPDKSLFSIRSHCQWEQESGGACMSAWGNGVTLTLSSHQCGRKKRKGLPQQRAEESSTVTAGNPLCSSLFVYVSS